MGSEWVQTTVGEFCPFIYGKALPERARVPGGYPVISSAGITGSHNTPLTSCGGIVIGRKGTVGSVTLCEEPFWPIDTAYYVLDEPNKRDLHFTYYLLSTIGLSGMNSDSAVPGLNRDNAHALSIKVPSITIQKHISAILRALDDRIALLRETNTTLEAIAQTLFKSWFVDFDPVHANAGSKEATLPPEIQALFPSRFVESEQGLIPEGWEVGVFGDIAQQKKGSVNPLRTPDQIFEHYSLPAFDNNQIPVFEPGEFIKSNKTPLPENAVLLSKLNPHIPRVWLPLEYGSNAVCSTEFLAYSPKGCASKEFFFTLFSSSVFLVNLQQLVTGTSNSHQRVKPDQILEIGLVIPSKEVLSEFEKTTHQIFSRIGVNRAKSQTLANLRDTLLPRLISGQLQLPDFENELKDAI